jgi:hypothetical protein
MVSSRKNESDMTRAEALFSLIGGVVGFGLAGGSAWLLGAHSAPRREVAVLGTTEDGTQDDAGNASVDLAMAANANLVESLRECSQRLSRLTDDESRIEQQVEAERMAEADASQASLARRRARREPSQSDWRQLASTGTIRYLLPCASFNPTPEVMGRLALAQQDVPAIQSAFTAARDDAWTQIRPLCAAAAGSTGTADKLGLDACPQVIFNAERATDPAAAAFAMRAVGAVQAGLAEPSTVPAGDPVGAAFLVLTGVAKDAETKLGSVLGPEDAHTAVYGSGSCGHTSEFGSPVEATAR